MERKVLKRFEGQRIRTAVGETSKTKQSFKDDCDINKIVKRHAQTGLWDHVGKREPHYGDFSKAQDLKEMTDQVMAAQAEFDALPSAVRGLCRNNPEILLRALASPEETAALFDAGLPMAEDYEPWREEVEDEKPEEPEEKPPSIEGGE